MHNRPPAIHLPGMGMAQSKYSHAILFLQSRQCNPAGLRKGMRGTQGTDRFSSSGVGGPETKTAHEALPHLQMVSTSMPLNPKAESPSTATTSRSGQVAAAAMAYPRPTPMVPQVPASSLVRGSVTGSRMTLQGRERQGPVSTYNLFHASYAAGSLLLVLVSPHMALSMVLSPLLCNPWSDSKAYQHSQQSPRIQPHLALPMVSKTFEGHFWTPQGR